MEGNCTSFKQAARQASLEEVNTLALSSPAIMRFGTRSNVHGRLQTLSANKDSSTNISRTNAAGRVCKLHEQ
jgi:hypothetical protein